MNEKAIIAIFALPGKKKFKIRGFDSFRNAWLIELSEQAEKGKANTELLRELKKLFGREVQILHGTKSRLKIVEIDGLSNKEVEQKLISLSQENA